MIPWFRPTVGVALSDGVGELDATAAFEVYSQSAAARTVAIATADTIRTRHGLVLLTTSVDDAPALSRVVVPGSETPGGHRPRLGWADNRDVTLERLAGPDGTSGGGFTAALQNLADHTDGSSARATAKMVGYPTTDLSLGAQHRSWRTVLLGILGLALVVLVGRAPAVRRALTPTPTVSRSAATRRPMTPGRGRSQTV